MNNNLLDLAVNPSQYDSTDLNWTASSGLELSPRSEMIWECISPYENLWKGKTVLDIGTGTGWMLNRFLELGAIKVTGVEPSQKSILLGRKSFPKVTFVETSFDKYAGTSDAFNLISSILSFSHIRDVDGSFKKIAELLTSLGKFLLIIQNYEYGQAERHGYEISKQVLSEREVVVSVKRKICVMTDILRKSEVYIEAALNQGLTMESHQGLHPTKNFIELNPSYQEFENTAIFELMIFKKSG